MRLHALQLGGVHAVLGDARHLLAQGVLHGFGALPGGRYAGEQEQPGATPQHRSAAVGTVGHAAGALGQRTLQARAVVATEHGREHQQGQGIAVLRGHALVHAGDARHMEGQRHVGLFGRGLDLDAPDTALRGLRARLAHRQGTRRNAAVGLLGPGTHLRRIHVAGHHHHGVAGHVPLAVERTHVIRGQRVEVAHPANDGAVVRKSHVAGRVELLHQQGARIVLGAHAALFLDDLDLFRELGVGPLVVGETVGLKLHHLLQA